MQYAVVCKRQDLDRS